MREKSFRLFKPRSKHKRGLAPGAIQHIGEVSNLPTKIRVIRFDASHYTDEMYENLERSNSLLSGSMNRWVHITGLSDTSIIEEVGKIFHLHPLVLEDIVNTDQQPKIEEYEDSLFIVMKKLKFDDKTESIRSEHVPIVLGKNFILTFREEAGDIFDSIRHRIEKSRWRERGLGVDYLAYALIDAIVDAYFSVLEEVGERIESCESLMDENPSPEILKNIHTLRNELIFMKKALWPLRELAGNLVRKPYSLIDDAIAPYLRDLYDHVIQIVETTDLYREMLSSMRESYASAMSTQMNRVMQVLTIIATIFIPLTFIAGIYGMNFEYMPELSWKYAYPVIWGLMLMIASFMLLYFRKKRWL
jgi:magnesium transporter